MGRYRVLSSFSDLQDNDHIYRPGDEFPRAGVDVSIDRLTDLSTSSNRTGHPLIEFIEDQTESSDTSYIEQESEPALAPAPKAEEKPKKRSKRSTKAQ